MISESSGCRLLAVLRETGIARSIWYRRRAEDEAKRAGPKPQLIAPDVFDTVVAMATANPWYGYKRIAVMCRRASLDVTAGKTTKRNIILTREPLGTCRLARKAAPRR